jgi:hypothetical protein
LYQVTVTRETAGGGSNNADLSDFTLSVGGLDQSFNAATVSYTSTVGYMNTGIMITPTLADPNASVTVDGQAVSDATESQIVALGVGGSETAVDIVVTAEDTVTTKTYTVTVTRDFLVNFAEQAYAKASNTGEQDRFAQSVAISGDTMVVGAPYEDSNATGIDGNQTDNSAADSGAVYVFTRSAGVWTQQAYIKQPSGDHSGSADLFGLAVDVDGDTLVVGAPQEDSNVSGAVNAASFPAAWGNTGLGASGAAYVFKRTGATWAMEAFLKASNVQNGDAFGTSVAISGDTVAVGAIYEQSGTGDEADNSMHASGAVYTYTRSGVTWSFEKYHKATNITNGDQFGISVDIDGDFMVVGSPQEDGDGTGINPADNSGAGGSGAAYIFERSGTWNSGVYVKASNTGGGDQFGHDVAIKGSTVVVGASREAGNGSDESNNSSWGAGAVYVFTQLLRSTGGNYRWSDRSRCAG